MTCVTYSNNTHRLGWICTVQIPHIHIIKARLGSHILHGIEYRRVRISDPAQDIITGSQILLKIS